MVPTHNTTVTAEPATFTRKATRDFGYHVQAAFYRRVWSAWGWAFDESHVERALAYQRDHYHASSAKLATRDTAAPLSESTWALPDGAAELYLNDPFVREVMAVAGWTDDLDALRSQPTPQPGGRD